jgi:MbtH protein
VAELRPDSLIATVGGNDVPLSLNDEGQYSMWPTTNEGPAGWSVAHGPADRKSCVEFIEGTWMDMRPKSLIDAMDNLAASS